MKKITALFTAILLMVLAPLTMASCQQTNTKYTIGICQLVKHDALDSATKGFKDAIVEALGEENVTFIEQNAQNNTETCTTIVNDFVSKNVDLILGNATAALQAAYAATDKIPVLGTSITDYVTALDIKDEFNGTIGGNVSGTSDLAPLDKQADMVSELFPAAKYPNVGILYCSAEANSKYQFETIKPLLESAGYTVKAYTYSDSNDVASVATAAAAASDVIYVPTDNTAASFGETIKSKIGDTPVIAGESSICSKFGVATLSIDYYELGKITGEMAVKILKGEANISDMPIEYAPATEKKYNAERCAELGLTLPADYSPIG